MLLVCTPVKECPNTQNSMAQHVIHIHYKNIECDFVHFVAFGSQYCDYNLCGCTMNMVNSFNTRLWKMKCDVCVVVCWLLNRFLELKIHFRPCMLMNTIRGLWHARNWTIKKMSEFTTYTHNMRIFMHFKLGKRKWNVEKPPMNLGNSTIVRNVAPKEREKNAMHCILRYSRCILQNIQRSNAIIAYVFCCCCRCYCCTNIIYTHEYYKKLTYAHVHSCYDSKQWTFEDEDKNDAI